LAPPRPLDALFPFFPLLEKNLGPTFSPRELLGLRLSRSRTSYALGHAPLLSAVVDFVLPLKGRPTFSDFF